MPELPEVETVRRGLAPALVGKRIAKAKTKRADLRFPFPTRFAARLKGRRVDALERRAKYLLAHLDDGMVWITHLGMTGRWSVIGAKKQPGDFYYSEPPDPTHTHVIIDMESGARLEFN
ncbi:MAG: DNA-formamidopyrimidine glycosylase, partial [Proteobacteria bacterium]|nr:DNA-formamidopyrimidine glycosylase [Pseudomonadota bacterium]